MSTLIFFASQLSATAYLHVMRENPEYSLKEFLDAFIYLYVPFYILFLSAIFNAIVITMACHEKISLKCIDYTPIHPLKGVDETNNRNFVFDIFSFEMCKEEHVPSGWIASKIKSVQLENMRRMHENICNVICQLNGAVAMQLLVFVVICLCVLVLQLYSVIIYLAYDFRSFEMRGVFVQQCFSVVMQCCGVYFLFRNVQSYSNQVS